MLLLIKRVIDDGVAAVHDGHHEFHVAIVDVYFDVDFAFSFLKFSYQLS